MRAGKIRYIGLSEVTPEEIEAAQQIVPIVSVQNRYSLADRRHDATLTWCEACGIAFMPWYPIAAGKLLQPSHPAAQTLSRIAATHKATVAQISLAWLLAKVFDVLGAIQSLSLVVAGVMGIAALLLVANTIQVAAYSKRREVAVMKLVGASNWFIQMPFVLEAVFAAVLGALLAGVMLIFVKIFLLEGSLSALTNLLTPVSWGDVLIMFPLLAGAGGIVEVRSRLLEIRDAPGLSRLLEEQRRTG